jgi:hypothetical protein
VNTSSLSSVTVTHTVTLTLADVLTLVRRERLSRSDWQSGDALQVQLRRLKIPADATVLFLDGSVVITWATQRRRYKKRSPISEAKGESA